MSMTPESLGYQLCENWTNSTYACYRSQWWGGDSLHPHYSYAWFDRATHQQITAWLPNSETLPLYDRHFTTGGTKCSIPNPGRSDVRDASGKWLRFYVSGTFIAALPKKKELHR